MADIQKLNVNSTTYDISVPWGKVTGKPNYYVYSTQRDFGSGTLIKTDINYNSVSGDPFYGEIKGNTYTGAINSCFTQFQGYIYDNTIIAYGVTHLGSLHITPITAMNIDGKLCFWFPRLGYWMGFSVKVTTGYDYSINRVASVIDSAEPNGTKKVVLTSSTVYNINSQNIGSQSVNYATNAGSASSAGNADTVDGYHHTSFAKIADVNNLMHSGNEFTYAAPKYSGDIWHNYRTSSWGTDGSIASYRLGNGAGGYASVFASTFYNSSGTEVSYQGHTHNYAASSHTHTKSQITDFPTIPSYSTATSSTLGLVKIGYTANGKNYPVQLSNGQMYVNVPWTDTNTDTNTWRPVTNTYTGSDTSTCVSQKGTNDLYNALVNGYANSAGYASSAGSIPWSGVTGKPVLPVYYNLSGSDAYSILKNNATSFVRNQLVHAYLGHGSASFAMGWVLSGYDSSPYCAFIVNGYGDNWSLVGSSSGSWTHRTLLHSGNISSYALTSLPSHTHDYAASNHTHTSFANSITVTGSVSASSGFYQSSDERLKTFYDPIKVDLEKLKTLRKNYFKFNDRDELEIGVSAQEIQQLYPEIVSTDDNGYLSVAYDKLSVIALKAIDELNDINDKQQKEIDDLKDQLSTIKNILKEKGIL